MLPGPLTPRVQESLVWLGIWMPFGQAAEALAFFTGVTVSEPTVRRTTEGTGAAYEALQTTAVETIEQTLPLAPAGPAVQVLSVDAAMAPLVHQEWAEVKTLALGTVGRPVCEGGEWVVHTQELSSCSRLSDAETFGRMALVEAHRRGTETARTVCAVSDGAKRIQRQERRQAKQPPAALDMASASVPVVQPAALLPVTAPVRHTASLSLASSSPKVPYRPPPAHPWRRFRIGRVRAQPPAAACVAKL